MESVATYEIIEEYPDDKYLPSYLIRAVGEDSIIHIHIAVDVEGDGVTVVTAYRPSSDRWDEGFRKRRIQ